MTGVPKKCTRVAGRAFPDGKSLGRNRVILVGYAAAWSKAKMETVIHEISAAVSRLGLEASSFRQLPALESRQVFLKAVAHFVKSGDRRWWWEDFRLPGTSVTFPDGRGFERLAVVVPDPQEPLWFIVEETLLDHYPVFETTAAVAQSVIGECYGFEYYLISKDLSWLVCENHHDRVIAIGAAVEQRLLELAA